MGHLRDPVAGRPWDQMIGCSRDARGTLVKHVFKIQLTNTLNLLWQVTEDLILNGSSEEFCDKYSG